jgi:hypothetical protein
MVIANAFGLGTGNAYAKSPHDGDVLIAAADGVQIEGFTRWGDAPVGQVRKNNQWDQDLALLELLAARGKTALAYTKVNGGASPAQLAAVRDFALGSFLESFTPGRSYFGFDDGRRIPAVASDVPWARSLGMPSGAKVADGQAWVRSFAGGNLTMRNGAPPAVS